MTGTYLQSCRFSSRPLWLQTALAEIDQKMQDLAVTLPEEEDSDSFADRAENYYRKRPQLISLLQDLYNRYLTMADRYCQTLKTQQISTVHSDIDDDNSLTTSIPPYPDSDTESSISYQTQKPSQSSSDAIVTELVSKNIENELLRHEIDDLGRFQSELLKKVELQKSLLEVLESERVIMVNENSRLGCRVTSAVEENKGLVSELLFMKRKASELATYVLKMRDDHRVCLLSRKVGDLQGQIYGLEKRNKEYYEELVRREAEKREIVKEVWVEVEKLKKENERLKEEALKLKEGWRVMKWWDQVKKMDMFFVCGPQPRKWH